MKPKITKPGIYDMSLAEYHGQPCEGPSVSSSGLRTIFSQSPAHYWVGSSLNPDAETRKETEAFTLGKGAHHLLLGEDDFSTLFIARPESIAGEPWQGNRTVCKAWLKDQANAGRTVLTPDQIAAIRGMAKSLSTNSLVQAGILNGEVEKSLIWKDAETGVWLKARPDVIPNDSGDFSDLKTTTDVGYDELSKAIGEFGYHQQAALVGEGYKAITGKPMTSFSLCFVEKKAPYCSRIVTLKDADLERGAKQNRVAIRMFADCLEKGVWPGPGDYEDASFIEIPTWMQTRIDKELEYRGVK